MQLDDISSISLLPVRDQGKAGTCLAFATSSAHEHAHGINNYLSPAYLYGLAWPTDPALDGRNGLTIRAVKNVISDKGQIHEENLPYEEWLKSLDFPNAAYIREEQHFLSGLSTLPADFNEISEYLKNKIPIIMGIRITDAFYNVDSDGYIDERRQREMGGHAVVAVGKYKNEQSKEFLLIRNSWGDAWGKNGHALISEEYIMRRIMFAAILNSETV